MSGTWCSVELKKAIDMGYIISNIHAGFKHKLILGLMENMLNSFKQLRLVLVELKMLQNVIN